MIDIMSGSIVAVLIFIASLFLGLKVGKKKGSTIEAGTGTDEIVFPLIDVNLFNRFSVTVKELKEKYPFTVPEPLVYSVIKKESDSLYKTKTNGEVIGDKNLSNKAFGFMQVRLPALLDTNARYGFSFSEEDLKNEITNLTVGIGYLSMCFEKAVSENAKDVVRLTFKKYNSGIGTKENALGGTGYSSIAINYYEIFNGLT